MKDFYERFESLLQSRNISKNQFAKFTGISTGNLGNWKRGESLPGANALLIISDFFKVSIDWLLRGDGAGFSQDLDSEMIFLLEQYKRLPEEKQKKVCFMLQVALNSLDNE